MHQPEMQHPKMIEGVERNLYPALTGSNTTQKAYMASSVACFLLHRFTDKTHIQ